MEPAFSQEATRVSGRRFVAHFVDVWLSMMASDHRQRFGNRWGKTYVVVD